jgi:outer membrane protein OmpA-like peptidoglycan-associated protein
MSSQSKRHHRRVFAMLAAVTLLLGTFTTLAAAQDQPVQKWEIYAGYSIVYPNTTLNVQLPGALFPLTSPLETNPWGIGASGTYNFNHWFGLTVDGSNHWGSGELTVAKRIDDMRFDNISIGPKLTYRAGRFAPFFEVLVGDHRVVPEVYHSVDKLGVMVGGGLDVTLSRHFAWRVFRLDYAISNYQFGPAATTASTELRAVRGQMGLVYRFGGGPPPVPPSAACSAQPTEVFAGEPVTVTAVGSNFNPKRTVKYSWSGTPAKISGNNSSAQVDTAGWQPSSYTATANLSDGSKHGVASCNASFTVKTPRPPTIACSPNPETVQPGGSSTITSIAGSPDNRGLTYSYAATAGSISGNESSTTLNAGNAQPGQITVTCNVADDRNPALTASATTAVNVVAPPPQAPPAPAVPEASKLNQIDFKKNSPRVDNAAKAILDEVALRLQRDSDAKAVIVGEADPSEKNATALAAQRAFNTSSYLVNEKGIDASRLETRTGSEGTQQAQIWLVPAGATFNEQGTQVAEQPTPRRGKRK